MSARRLVICLACERPQFRHQDPCVACGAVLPQEPATKEALQGAREKILDAYDPYLEGGLGRGRRLLLSEKRLEWRVGHGAALQLELSELKAVRLKRRPVYEALVFTALCGALAWLLPIVAVKAVLAALAVAFGVACFAQRRLSLEVEGPKGRLEIWLGMGTRRAEIARAVDSVWESFKPELQARGVSTE